MTQPSAFDPSTWTDGDPADQVDAEVWLSAAPPAPLDDAPPEPEVRATEHSDLQAEVDDLKELRASHVRKILKLRGFIEAGEGEIERIDIRLVELDRLITESEGGA